MALGLDSKGTIHWLFPAWLDETTDPESMMVPPRTPLQVTAELVAPDQPAAGPIRFIAFITEHPMRVKQVEARLEGARLNDSVSGVLGEATVRESLATWEPSK